MLLLAVDSSTESVTAGLHDGTQVLAEATELGARRHGELLAVLIQQVLRSAGRRPADLTAVIVGVGPGPFTSLRVAVVTGIGVALPYDLPVHGVCSLDAIAREVAGGPLAPASAFVVVTDARRREVYWAGYDAAGRRLEGPAVERPAVLVDQLGGRPVAGAGALLYPDLLGPGLGSTYVSAGVLAAVAAEAIANGVELLPARPLYLRRPDASEPRSAMGVHA